jgi:hypothetical protein
MDFLVTLPQYLTRVVHGFTEYGQFVNGYIGNLKVNIKEDRVKIGDNKGNNSLCKYYLGDNFKTLSRGDTEKAIEKLSDSIHLPMERANVTRIDVAQNLMMKNPERVYYSCLGQAQHYSRLEHNNGLYYVNQSRQLVFYGKEHEQRTKGQPIPEMYRGRYIIRYEHRYLKKLLKQFNRYEITGATLSEEDFYSDIVKRWKNEYLAIKKINSKINSMKPTGSTKKFIENLAVYAIIELGQPQVLTQVKAWQKSGYIDKIQAYRLTAVIKDICEAPQGEARNELIAEMDRKINEAARYW